MPLFASTPPNDLTRRPVYPRLVPFSFALLAAAFVSDLAYWRTAAMMWATFSVWLIAGGLVMAGIAALCGLFDLVTRRRLHALTPPWPHVLGDALAVILGTVNVFVHSRDGYTAVVPTGIILSAMTVLVLLLSRLYRPDAGPAAVTQYSAPRARRRGAVVSVLELAAFLCGLGSVWLFSGPAGAMIEPATQYGANPELPAPHQYLLPPMRIAPDVGWAKGETPTVSPGLKVQALAQGFQHPRSVYVLPNNDVLVVESSGPPAPVNRPKDLVMGWVQSFSGSKAKGANRITLIRDPDGSGVPAQRSVFLDHLNSPFGVALVGHDLYVADTDALLRFPYNEGDTRITAPGVKVTDLPRGPINHHWTKSLVASKDGSKLYVGVGSNSNIVENGFPAELDRADVLEIDPATGLSRVFASGLRNPAGITFEPKTDTLWAVVNERDELGPNLVPDYLTSVKDGAFYGWPYSYYGQHVDKRVRPQRPDLVAKAISPDYALSSHVAPLGVAFYNASNLPAAYRGGVFVGEHGSWDRTPLNGYKVVYIPFSDGKPNGAPLDVVTGFLNTKNEARGRPVGLAVDQHGALLIADDLGNTVWRVTGE